MATIDKISIFPYFGGSLNMKQLTETNINKLLKNIGVPNQVYNGLKVGVDGADVTINEGSCIINGYLVETKTLVIKNLKTTNTGYVSLKLVQQTNEQYLKISTLNAATNDINNAAISVGWSDEAPNEDDLNVLVLAYYDGAKVISKRKRIVSNVVETSDVDFPAEETMYKHFKTPITSEYKDAKQINTFGNGNGKDIIEITDNIIKLKSYELSLVDCDNDGLNQYCISVTANGIELNPTNSTGLKVHKNGITLGLGLTANKKCTFKGDVDFGENTSAAISVNFKSAPAFQNGANFVSDELVTFQAPMDVRKSATFNSITMFNGNTTFQPASGNATQFLGTTKFDSGTEFTVNSIPVFNSNTTFNKNLTLSSIGTLDIKGNSIFGGPVSFGKITNFNNDANFNGSAKFSSTTTLGGRVQINNNTQWGSESKPVQYVLGFSETFTQFAETAQLNSNSGATISLRDKATILVSGKNSQGVSKTYNLIDVLGRIQQMAEMLGIED